MLDARSGPISLRDGVEADAERFFELDQLCFAAATAYPLAEFRRLLRSRRTLSVVAEGNNSLAGFAIAGEAVIRKSRGGHLITLDVAPAFRRCGVGRLLMTRIEDRLRAGGAEWVQLEVAENNAAARSFYLSLGFAAIGEIPGYYERAITAIVMVKQLRPPA